MPRKIRSIAVVSLVLRFYRCEVDDKHYRSSANDHRPRLGMTKSTIKTNVYPKKSVYCGMPIYRVAPGLLASIRPIHLLLFPRPEAEEPKKDKVAREGSPLFPGLISAPYKKIV